MASAVLATNHCCSSLPCCHRVAANKAGVQLYLPLIIPVGFGFLLCNGLLRIQLTHHATLRLPVPLLLPHRVAANKAGVQLYLPLIIPAGFGFLGSFGGITRFKGFVPNRETLLDVAVAGPLWGSAASGALLLLGLALSSAGLGDVSIDSPGLADSFLVALLGQAALGEALANPEVRNDGNQQLNSVDAQFCVVPELLEEAS